jgi:hypothetical protein
VTKRRLLDECELWCVLSLPGGVFSTAGAGVKTNLLFFTKGRPTGRICSYDLSAVKVGKKQPMTLAHFGFDKTGAVLDDHQLPDSLLRLLVEGVAESTEDSEAIDTTPMTAADAARSQPVPTFARLLASRGMADGESPLSWTLDIAARREKAREEMAPPLKEAARQKALAITLRSEFAVLRRAKASDEKIEPIQSRISAAERAAREAQAKADAIDAAVFDLKAVNPRARSDRDNRTPEEVLTAIADHQRTIDLALKRLGRLLEAHRLQGISNPRRDHAYPTLVPRLNTSSYSLRTKRTRGRRPRRRFFSRDQAPTQVHPRKGSRTDSGDLRRRSPDFPRLDVSHESLTIIRSIRCRTSAFSGRQLRLTRVPWLEGRGTHPGQTIWAALRPAASNAIGRERLCTKAISDGGAEHED